MGDRHSQIQTILADLLSAQKRAATLAARTSDERWLERNNPSAWSVSECIEHLNMTTRAFVPLIRTALELPHGKPANSRGAGKFRRDLVGFLLSAMVGPLRKFGRARLGRVKTTPEFEPKNTVGKRESLVEFDRLQVELIRLIQSTEQSPLNDLKIVSPFGGKLRYNLYSAFRILPSHQHRHLQQAEEVWQ